MTISLNNHEGYQIAELNQVRFNGLPGIGCYTLVASLDFSVSARPKPLQLRGLQLRLEWGDNTQSLLAIAYPEQAQPVQIPNHNSLTIGFRMTLSMAQIEAIEFLRGGANFDLSLWFYSEIVEGNESRAVSCQTTVTVKQSEWIAVLEKMGYQETLLLEFGLLQHIAQNSGVVKCVQIARNHFFQGNYNECVGECRKLLEIFKLDPPESNELGVARTKFLDRNERESMTVKERILILRAAIHHTTNLPHHFREEEQYDYYQARVILHSVIAILPGYGTIR